MAIVSWITLKEASRVLNRSPRTIERLTSSGVLDSRLEERAGRKAERVYRAADVERLAAQGVSETLPTLRPALKAPAPNGNHSLTLSSDFIDRFRDVVIDGLAEHREKVPIHLKLWLSLNEARAYSGLSKPTLLQLLRDGKLEAMKSGGWKIKRASLEKL